MTKYRIKFWIKNGKTVKAIIWERFGNSMEECLALTKTVIKQEYGDEWNQSIAICGPQLPTDVYAF
jgi:hypothetical protein